METVKDRNENKRKRNSSRETKSSDGTRVQKQQNGAQDVTQRSEPELSSGTKTKRWTPRVDEPLAVRRSLHGPGSVETPLLFLRPLFFDF